MPYKWCVRNISLFLLSKKLSGIDCTKILVLFLFSLAYHQNSSKSKCCRELFFLWFCTIYLLPTMSSHLMYFKSIAISQSDIIFIMIWNDIIKKLLVLLSHQQITIWFIYSVIGFFFFLFCAWNNLSLSAWIQWQPQHA